MDVSYLLDKLNDPQREAVTASPGHLLILAGAGSGKTRVLTHRIAWLVEVERASPLSILAVTFTNKAAAQMRERVEQLLKHPVGGMWIGTFHNLAHRLLRAHWRDAGLRENFQIIDSQDQLRLVKRIHKSMDLDEKQWPAKQAQWYINQQKDKGLRAKHISADNYFDKQMLTIYTAYEEACLNAGLVDFAELLLRAYELWHEQPSILAHYQKRFSHILIDEFQDTNTIQYQWLRMLVHDSNYLMAVGDDDQSIYGWRGAQIDNIHHLSDDLPDVKTIRLEQNYRSTGTILAAANALIANNGNRLGKNLWTDTGDGEPITVYEAFNEFDEAQFIVEKILGFIREGHNHRDMAVLYRSNAQSRVIEQALLQRDLPYRIYGGLRFFERAEIKDALGYLRLMMSRFDDAAFERVVNMPTRGIGEKTLAALRIRARDYGQSLWEAAHGVIEEKSLTARALGALQNFLTLIDTIDAQSQNESLPDQLNMALELSGLLAHAKQKADQKGEARYDNLMELVTATQQYEQDADEDENVLESFLSHAALEAGDFQAQHYEDSVQLMTLHSAKGLEFPIVFLAGCEEGLFPHRMSTDTLEQVEEERRLCYVGITRAEERLFMSYAEKRHAYGADTIAKPSRFILEIPKDCLDYVRMQATVSRPSPAYAAHDVDIPETNLSIGQRVLHPSFGEGVVLNFEGSGARARIQVEFEQAGCKWLMFSHANLQLV